MKNSGQIRRWFEELLEEVLYGLVVDVLPFFRECRLYLLWVGGGVLTLRLLAATLGLWSFLDHCACSCKFSASDVHVSSWGGTSVLSLSDYAREGDLRRCSSAVIGMAVCGAVLLSRDCRRVGVEGCCLRAEAAAWLVSAVAVADLSSPHSRQMCILHFAHAYLAMWLQLRHCCESWEVRMAPRHCSPRQNLVEPR